MTIGKIIEESDEVDRACGENGQALTLAMSPLSRMPF